MHEPERTAAYTFFHGPYHEVVTGIFSPRHVALLRPRVLWLEWRTIPIPTLQQILPPDLTPHIFFLPILTQTTWHQLLASSQLATVTQWGFHTLMIHLPSFQGVSSPSGLVTLRQMRQEIHMIVFASAMELNPFPATEGRIVEVPANA